MAANGQHMSRQANGLLKRGIRASQGQRPAAAMNRMKEEMFLDRDCRVRRFWLLVGRRGERHSCMRGRELMCKIVEDTYRSIKGNSSNFKLTL